MKKVALQIRKATPEDHDQIWSILRAIIQRGDVFAYPVDATKEQMLTHWCGSHKHTYVALENSEVVGTFSIRNNQPGRGSHVANAGYAVSPLHGRKGIGKAMGEFSLKEAKRLGYHAMQYNLVVKSNEHAVKLWQEIGFKIIGEVPEAFDHLENGLTNAYIMYRKLE